MSIEAFESDCWPERFFSTIPSSKVISTVTVISLTAEVGGVIARIAFTAACTLVDALCLAALVMSTVSANPIVMVVVTVFFALPSVYVTWRFWTPAVGEYTAQFINYLTGSRKIPEASHEKNVSALSQFLAGIGNSFIVVGYVSVVSSVISLCVATNENNEAIVDFFNITGSSWRPLVIGLILGGIATAYSIVTEIRMLWQDRLLVEEKFPVVQEPSIFRYVIAFVGSAELFWRTWILDYIKFFDMTGTPLLAIIGATCFTLSGAVANFMFQAIYALEGSPLIAKVNRFLVRMRLSTKLTFLVLMGLTIAVNNMTETLFITQTLLILLLSLSPALSLGIAIATAVLITLGDLLTSYWDGVVVPTMGWARDLDMLYLNGSRGPVSISAQRLPRGGKYWRFFDAVASQSQGLSVREQPADTGKAGTATDFDDKEASPELDSPRNQEGQRLLKAH